MNDPVAIVTGAGSGIGRGVAVQLSAMGYRIALVGRTQPTLQETMELAGSASSCLTIVADIASRDASARITQAAIQKWGRVDALVNNAAIAPFASLSECDWAELERTFAANTFGPACLIAALWPTFVAQRGGRIVNVSSMSTIDPFPGLAVYAASKSALESLTRSIQAEGEAHNIKSFNIAPGAVETQMLRAIADENAVPRERTLSPEAVAEVIVGCVTGRRDDANGTTIVLRSP
jgi:short-subunit dehydrogenase